MEQIARPPTQVQTEQCFSCGRMFSTPGGRFCSAHCRAWFDAGNPPYETPDATRFYSLPPGASGFLIFCAGCGKRFDSKGLRYCSAACARSDRAAPEALASARLCNGCGRPIPTWQDGRRVRSDAKFCSRDCRNRNRKVSGYSGNGPNCQNPGFGADNAQKVPILRPSKLGPRRTDLAAKGAIR